MIEFLRTRFGSPGQYFRHPICLSVRTLVLSVVLLASSLAPLPGQEEGPNLDELERNVVSAREAAHEHPENAAAWSMLMFSEQMLAAVRLGANRTADQEGFARNSEELIEKVLHEWRELRPEDAGPDLFRANRIQDPKARENAILDLLERYPGDETLVAQAGQLLRNRGEVDRAAAVMARLRQRRPASIQARQLEIGHYLDLQDRSRVDALVLQWVEDAPTLPAALMAWLDSGWNSAEPERTRRLLEDAAKRASLDESLLQLCVRVSESPQTALHAVAAECLARFLGDTNSAPAMTERASTALARIAVREGDLERMSALLRPLPPEVRASAMVAAATAMSGVENCSRKAQLLREGLGDLHRSDGQGQNAISSLRECSRNPQAERLFLDLLAAAPIQSLSGIVASWIYHVNGQWRGWLPLEGTIRILESRLPGAPGPMYGYLALEMVYDFAGRTDKQRDLLIRWQGRSPESFPGDRAVTLAEELVLDDKIDVARAVLEKQLTVATDERVATALWQIHLLAGNADAAQRLGERLVASSKDSSAASTGHLLLARSAVTGRDFETAARHYREYLTGSANLEVAAELVGSERQARGLDAARAAASEICSEPRFRSQRRDAESCAAGLLESVGEGAAAAQVLEEASRGRPGDIELQISVAQAAESNRNWPSAESAWRRVIAASPSSPRGWESLAAMLYRRGNLSGLEHLVDEARRAFPRVPNGMLVSLGKAAVDQGEIRRGIAAFEEARANLPEGVDPGWIDYELQRAYIALGGKE